MTNDRVLRGPVVRPTNAHYNDPGGIHDDATAQELGFRGGTIAGSAHLDTFVPLLLQAFGDEWFRTGSISMYFRHATVDGEPTQAFVDLTTVHPAAAGAPVTDAQVRVWMETTDGAVVGEGTASVGQASEPTALAARDLRHDPSNARILAGVERGRVLGTTTALVEGRRVALGNRGRITEPLDRYVSSEPFGGPVAPPSALIDLFANVAGDTLLPEIGPAVGMWGALEVRFHHGPVFVDTGYEITTTIAAVGETPKTEVLWYDSVAERDGVAVASVRILSRFVKASSAEHH